VRQRAEPRSARGRATSARASSGNQVTDKESSGKGPYSDYAHFKHWWAPFAYLVLVISGVLYCLVQCWPRCEESQCDARVAQGAGTTAATSASAAPTRPKGFSSAARIEPEGAASTGSAVALASAPDGAAPVASAEPGATVATSGSAVSPSPNPPAGSANAATTATPPPAPSAAPAPGSVEITRLSPTSGDSCGGLDVTFLTSPLPPGDVSVRFGGIPSAVVEVRKARTEVVARTPRHWAGAVDVTLRAGMASGSLLKGFNYACPDHSQERLLLLVVLAGALGGALHAMRSLFYFIGNRDLRVSWLPSYIAMPFTGAAVGTLFFLVFVAGFFMPQDGDAKTYFLMVGVSALVGMFTPQAVEKLKSISEAILTNDKPGARSGDRGPKDTAPAALGILKVMPKSAPAVGGSTATVLGDGFKADTTVTFDGIAARVDDVDPKALQVTIPARPAGKGPVDVEVKNKDGTSAKLSKAFEYS
jgi:hypothetical protein